MSTKRRTARASGGRRGIGRLVISEERRQLQEILSNVARILTMSGHTVEDLTLHFNTVCRGLQISPPSKSPSSSKIYHGQIISQWYRDPEYLDAFGKPRRLAFAGTKPSLTGLISRVLPGASPQYILDSLLELRAVRLSAGCYEPTGVQVNFHRNRAHLAYWNMKALDDVLRSMVHNYTCRPENQLLAKAASHPGLPNADLPAFHALVDRRALRFLNDIDANMHRLEKSSGRGQTAEVGVVMFAYENSSRSRQGESMAGKRSRRKSPRLSVSD